MARAPGKMDNPADISKNGSRGGLFAEQAKAWPNCCRRPPPSGWVLVRCPSPSSPQRRLRKSAAGSRLLRELLPPGGLWEPFLGRDGIPRISPQGRYKPTKSA